MTKQEELERRKREKNRRLRKLAQELSAEEYWREMGKVIRQPLGDNSSTPKSA